MKNANMIKGLTLLAAVALVSGAALAAPPWPTGGPIREPDLPDMHPCDYIDTPIQCVNHAPLTAFSLPREENKKKLLGELLLTQDECDLGNYRDSLTKIFNDVIPNLDIWLVQYLDPFPIDPGRAADPVFQATCEYGRGFEDELVDELETMVALVVDEMTQTPWPFDELYEGESNYRFYSPYNLGQQYWTIGDQLTWEEFWKEHYNGYPAAPAPDVDFGAELVVTAFLGIQTCAGYGIRVSDVFSVADGPDLDPYLVVAVERVAPGGEYCPWAMSNPSAIAATDKTLTSKPIIVIDAYSRNTIDIIYTDDSGP